MTWRYSIVGGHPVINRTLHVRRASVPINSFVKLYRDYPEHVTAPPQSFMFRPEKFVIGGNPHEWLVRDVTIDGKSLMQGGAELDDIQFGFIEPGEELGMVVEYLRYSGGAVFGCAVIGTAMI